MLKIVWTTFLALGASTLLTTALTGQLAAAPAPSAGRVVVSGPDGLTDLVYEIPPTTPGQPASQAPAPPPGRSSSAKIHTDLLGATSGLESREVEVVLTFHDEVSIPRFPEPVVDAPAGAPENLRARSRAGFLVGRLEERRRATYEERRQELEPLGITVLETFWLVDAMLVRMPLAALEQVASRRDVLFIEPRHTDIPPPGNTVADARAYLRSDTLANLASGGYVGLLDTGVRSSHTLLSNPSPLRYQRDCVNGTSNNCTSGTNLNPDDDCWNHGTSTAAIITGNSNLGNAYRGVDWITLDSFKVYPENCGGLDVAATIRGFQAAVAALDQVIVAEMQGSGNETSSVSVTADNAYDAGAIVVAANGNNGPNAGTVNSPANAHKVLGVGAFDVSTLSQYSGQSRGPTSDGRIKPDIQTPTNTKTASTASSTALHIFTGTSGSTPYAAALAIGLRNWIARTPGSSWLPGMGYAWTILFGDRAYPFDNTTGAGHLRFNPDAIIWQAYATMTPGGQTDIPINSTLLSQFPKNLAAAIWWPESTSLHNNLDLFIVDPGGTIRASSVSVGSVLERAFVPGTLASGIWKVRIKNHGASSQEVFMGAYRTR